MPASLGREALIAASDDPKASIHTTTALPAAGLDAEAVKEWLHAFARQTLDYAILLVDRDKRVLWANPGAGWVLAATANEIVGESITRFFTAEDRAFGVPEHEQRTAIRQGASDDDRWMLRADGSPFWASGRTVALVRTDGTPLGFFKIFRDETEIKMRIDVLEKHATPSPERTDAAMATLAAADDGAGPAQGIELRIERVLLRDEVDAAIAFAREHSDPGNRRITVLVPEGAPLVVDADRHRLRQLFAILIGNAIRATSEDGHIWINGTPQDEQAVIRVSDNGAGISGERLENLFELFTDAALPLQEAEAGVGMALVRTIVELHGGTVQAQSAGPGKGSEFTVRLPLASAGEVGRS
ncbi:MAG: ATP-binding protein [Luteimonas sp.]